jgi:nitrate/nitrite transporter NarK
MAASTFVQFMFGVLARFLLDEFSISRSQLGLLTTAAFIVGGVGSVPAGNLTDRMGGRRIFMASLGLVIVATLGMAVAPSYAWLLLGATVGGGALATCNPTTNKMIAAHTDPGERGVIMGIKQAGVQIGAFVVGISVPATATALGWRTGLAVIAVVPALVILATLVLVPADPVAAVPAGRPESSTPLDPVVWWMTAYALLMGSGVAAFSSYIPLYAEEGVGLSVNAAGTVAATIGGIGIASRVLWGWAAERLGNFRKPLAYLGLGAVASTLLVIAAQSLGGWLLWIAAVLFGASAITWNAIGMLAILVEVSAEDAGRASGYVQTGFYGGFVVSPILFGYSVDVTGGYGLGWGSVAVVFLLATLLALGWEASRRQRS